VPDSTSNGPAAHTGSGLEVQDLTVRYGPLVALSGVELTFPPGKVTAVVGPNGAGKSSLIQALAGAVPSTGTVTLDGQDLSSAKPAERARQGVGLVPQGRQIFPTLTVTENLAVFAEVLGLGEPEIQEALERFPRLQERRSTFAGNLSGGEQQMLAVTRAMMSDCRVLLFDEMTTGLAPLIVEQLLAVARDLAAGGAAVVMAEASSGVIRDEVDFGIVLLRGAVVDQVQGGLELESAYRTAMGMSQ
jgi:branched-chain amino acid transport system ATP-binding protein